ncbi:hypothetical protein [Pseudoalteromonas luteoviolacea]|uniref:Uncharacterized protein n=1 Tax=Pseudoalteromonas luteoviolacea S4054 TaxID=1129367 RepID=A0A0F6AB57_9GAMM|nr:hypothetical protein [Pseudoalteromonas luteoviolacea]AOT08602.1 hypothetical protein S4054249_12395 [Pseudoalteromonas luteoviolacea]AOT13518.1 hypothetical protein S40542_12370 [Pseudoalteromonas luteoviolacea]AOT18431.1 hypothetical protein S4054_12370 [Pseudoalteromonas luteoviolacea]KKE83400.1 hypothetical protein N479_13595 [Pseudoalteromonas luteoviolacea S4054]KZN75837.1 hypothetical protein N481_05690 [Pseudoalteromonas luteoviolacea S4047-1]
MKKWMLKLLGTDVTKPIVRSVVEPIWQNTGEVFYLLNTLQLRYKSRYGVVSIDAFDINSFFKNVDEPLDELVSEFGEEFTFSVCAVAWERLGNQTRVKAIDNAAVFRFNKSLDISTQALFQHQFCSSDESRKSEVNLALSRGVFKYYNVQIGEFINQLKEANKKINHERVKRHGITGENFHKDVFDRISVA